MPVALEVILSGIATLVGMVVLLKERGWWFTVAVLVAVLPVAGVLIANAMLIVPALRLGLPESWWAKKRYDAATKARARQRFPDAPSHMRDRYEILAWLSATLWAAGATLVAIGVI